MNDPQPGRPARSGILWRYFALTWLFLLLNEGRNLASVEISTVLAGLYAVAVLLTGSLLLLSLAFLPVLGLHRLLPAPDGTGKITKWDAAVFGTCVALFAGVQGFVLLDRYVFGIYGFHFNGFVWNLVTTKGGVDSMGAGMSTHVTFALVGLLIAAAQAGLLVAVLRVPLLRRFGEGKVSRRKIAVAAAVVVALTAFDKVTYGVSMFRSYGPVLTASHAFPVYIPVAFTAFLRKLGFRDQRDDGIRMSTGNSRLTYPSRPLEREAGRKPPNIVWLVAESLRSDMLDREIMPAAWAFSERAVRFERHYSGGNGTRMGMFTMFYGLHGNYFSPCMAELRSPVLIDAIQDSGYQLFLHTSAAFSFPEFDKTVFAKVPRALLQEGGTGEGWRRDREHVSKILAEIDSRDPARPFFAFMFFESPHAPYHFPEECTIRTPYPKDMNYLTMDLQKEIGLIKNRYINSCRHLDTQLERLLKRLDELKLLESTIVIITGDHGEEFMEKGRWGHHSAFTEEQSRVPLVLYVPGVAPAKVDRMSSHLDLPATLLTQLGAKNPPEDYSFGRDLLGGGGRDYTVISGWAEIAYVDDRYKSVFPLRSYDVVRRQATTRDDAPADTKAFMAASHDRLTKVMQELRRFQK